MERFRDTLFKLWFFGSVGGCIVLFVVSMAVTILVPDEPGDVGTSGSPIRRILFDAQLSSVDSDGFAGGELVLTVAAWREVDIKVDVTVHGGIRFVQNDTYEVNSDQVFSIDHIELQKDDVRTIRIPFSVPENLLYSGTYVATANVYEIHPARAELVEPRYVYLNLLVRENGSLILPDAEDLEKEHPFNWLDLRRSDQEIALLLDDTPQPQSGVVWLRLSSQDSEYQPVVEVRVSDNGPVRFDGNPNPFAAQVSPGTIESNGTRYISLPFEINPTADDGLYTVQVTVIASGDEQVDAVPVQIRVESSDLSAPQKWLSLYSE